MTILVIKNTQESTDRNKLNYAQMKEHHKTGMGIETQTAIDAVLHYWEHNCSHTINNAYNAFDDYGSSKGYAAFKHLALYFTGAKKGEKGEHDGKRKDAAALKYMDELTKIDELGLIQWHKERTGGPTSAEEQTKKDAKAAARAREQAENWIVEQAKTDPIYNALLKYKTAFVPLFIAHPKQATDQLDADIDGLMQGLAGVNLKKMG